MGGSDGGMGSMLPMIMMMGDGEMKSEDLLMMMMLGGGSIGGGDAGSMLPLLMLMGDEEDGKEGLDTSMLMMIMMMGQAQPGTVTVDPVTGLKVETQSPLNMMIPLMLLNDGKDGDSSDMLMMVMLMSQMGSGSPLSG